jgi:hypothetical protein
MGRREGGWGEGGRVPDKGLSNRHTTRCFFVIETNLVGYVSSQDIHYKSLLDEVNCFVLLCTQHETLLSTVIHSQHPRPGGIPL